MSLHFVNDHFESKYNADSGLYGQTLNSYSQLKEWLVDPPSEYRSAPLWDWNDEISKEGISFQLEEFKFALVLLIFNALVFFFQ